MYAFSCLVQAGMEEPKPFQYMIEDADAYNFYRPSTLT